MLTVDSTNYQKLPTKAELRFKGRFCAACCLCMSVALIPASHFCLSLLSYHNSDLCPQIDFRKLKPFALARRRQRKEIIYIKGRGRATVSLVLPPTVVRPLARTLPLNETVTMNCIEISRKFSQILVLSAVY